MSRPVEPGRGARSSSRAQRPLVPGGRAVVGFDGTAASVHALDYAAGWARRALGQLDVLYVSEDCWPRLIDACAAASPTAALPDCSIDIRSELGGAVADLLTDADLRWSYHTANGRIAHTLEAHADSIGADAIIVGQSHRCRRCSRSTSTAHRLLRCTRRIVIVVP